MAAKTETQETLDLVQEQMERLRQAFMRYFQGIERRPPTDERDRIKTHILRLRGEARQWNTKDRFRIANIHQKYLSYNRMWGRTLTEIENGTYYRHKAKIRAKNKAELQEAEAQEASGVPAAVDIPTAPKKRRAPAAGDGGITDERARRLYNVYMQAKKRTGERSNLSYDGLKKQLEKQIPAIKKKHNCQRVDFKVVLKNGKAMLKAVPK